MMIRCTGQVRTGHIVRGHTTEGTHGLGRHEIIWWALVSIDSRSPCVCVCRFVLLVSRDLSVPVLAMDAYTAVLSAAVVHEVVMRPIIGIYARVDRTVQCSSLQSVARTVRRARCCTLHHRHTHTLPEHVVLPNM